MDQFAEDEVEYATINRSHNTISQPVITELKNKFHYEIQDSSSEEETSEEEATETGSSESGSTVGSPSTIGEDQDEEESSDENNNKDDDDDADTHSIGSAASLLDFSDVNRERRVTQALNEALNPDSLSVCSTDVADIVQRQLAEFSMTLRRQIENDMQSLISKKMNSSEYGSQPCLPPATPSRKKHTRTKSEDTLNSSTKRKRPKKKQHYVSDDELFEIPAPEVDPNAPKPEGPCSEVLSGPDFEEVEGQARSIEEALHKHGTQTGKAIAFTILDNNGKVSSHVSYAKLLSRTQKIAYGIMSKYMMKEKGDVILKKGDRVALIYPSQDPGAFAAAFFACLFANLVPVPVEAPISNMEPGAQQLGFLLGSCGVQLALTSETGYKALPKDPSDHKVVQLKGWPKLVWYQTDSCPKPPKEWIPPSRQSPHSTAYIEYTTARNGEVMGVTLSRAALVTNTKAVSQACGYDRGKIIVSLVDPKREVGLAMSVLGPIYSGANTIFIPPLLSRNHPAAWLQVITKHKAQFAVTSSRAMLNALKVTQMPKDINLACLEMILVSDGYQPWTVYTCDSFQSSLQTKGLDPAAMCPCAYSPNSLTFALRRPRSDIGHRGVLSLSALSYNVVKYDEDANLTSLSLQDCGNVLPGVNLVILKLEGSMMCKTDEIGEICISSISCGSGYFGLSGKSEQYFKVIPLDKEGRPVGNHAYAKTGLLGFVNAAGSVFVSGTVAGMIKLGGRVHNSEDLRATVLAVEPPSFVHRLRVAIFSVPLLREERIVVVAEQSNNFSDEQSFQWMSHVQQAIESIHQVVVYGILLVAPSGLPKCSDGSLNIKETKDKFMKGQLNPSNILMFPYRCITNLPKPKNLNELPVNMHMHMALKSGGRSVEASGTPLDISFDDQDAAKKFEFLSETLRFRAQKTPEHVLFSLLDSKAHVGHKYTCSQLHRKAERIAGFTLEKAKLNSGDNVALLFPAGLELISAFYGCVYAGLVPVCIRPPSADNLLAALPTLKMMMECCNIMAILTTHGVMKLMTSKAGSQVVDPKKWPMFIETDDAVNKKKVTIYKPPTPEMIAYLDFSVNSNGLLTGVKMSHAACNGYCRALKSACELYPSRHLALSLDPFSGMGFVLWCLAGVYAGHHSILVPPSELETSPSLWLQAVSQYKVRDSFMSYTVLEQCTKELASNMDGLKLKGLDLGSIRTCLIVAEERPKSSLINNFSTLASELGLPSECISTTFGCRANIGMCCRGASHAPPSTTHVDLRALRMDKIVTVDKGSPHSVALMQSGTLLPGCKLIAVSLDKKEQCPPNQLGELWISSLHNCSGYYCLSSTATDPTPDHFNLSIPTANGSWSKTGYLGFISLAPKSTIGSKSTAQNAEVYVLGLIDETLHLRGMRYYPIDIESTISRCTQRITNSAVFTWQQLLVAVVEYSGPESEAMNVIPLVTSSVAEEHHLVVGVVVVVDPGTLPINSRGEKQRMHLRDGFLADSLDPIYITYNM
ncbi:disco-interacting protein 2 homolog C-like isoform X7 [Bolinopsis microptera]|uniref:disco-interacting protein 2 homolog C-like isoform X7 n=1 Tax=Bolinopsis microptera TaxID=2820187 RepID=UPI003078C465